MIRRQRGFTLIEVAFVLLIVAVLLGYTVAMFPKQQELKQYRGAQRQMDEIVATIVAFAQTNGRLPCPSTPASAGVEVAGNNAVTGNTGCVNYGGFVPVNTLGLVGDRNADSLLIDPWNNPYRYYVSSTDADDTDNDGFPGDGVDDFVNVGEMRDVGLVDEIDFVNDWAPSNPAYDGDGDDYVDLDGQLIICSAADATLNDICEAPAVEVFGRGNAGGPWGGAPFVVLSMGKNWSQAGSADEQLNRGASQTNTDLGMGLGPSGNEYLLKNVDAGETTFVRRITGASEDFDDLVRWASPNLLFSKMIDAGQLP